MGALKPPVPTVLANAVVLLSAQVSWDRGPEFAAELQILIGDCLAS